MRSQDTVLAKVCPGLRTLTAAAPPGAQSSEDQTLVDPDSTVRPIAARPMSRLQATLPVLVTETVSLGCCPAVYEVASVTAWTLITESGQSVIAAGVWLADGVFDTDGDGVLETDCAGLFDSDVCGDAELLGCVPAA